MIECCLKETPPPKVKNLCIKDKKLLHPTKPLCKTQFNVLRSLIMKRYNIARKKKFKLNKPGDGEHEYDRK